MEQVFSGRPDQKDQPLDNPLTIWFTDSSSFIKKGRKEARYAVVIVDFNLVTEAWTSSPWPRRLSSLVYLEPYS